MTTQRKSKKLFNFRLIAALALSLITGIISGALFAYFALEGIYLLVPFVVVSVPFAICTVKYKSLSLTVCFALVIAVFFIGALAIFFYCRSFTLSEITVGETYLIEGKVEKVGVTPGGTVYLVIGNARAGGVKLGGKVIAYLGKYAGDYCEKGYTVKFYASLSKESLFEGGEVSYAAQNSIKYFCSVSGGLESTWGFSLFGAANGAIRRALFDNLDGETASVCFAMLTGDSSLISQGTLTSFRYGGVAHLFAVSGLHIGVIFGALTLLFKKLPVNRYVSAAVRVGVILLYSGVCNFTPSSIRATVMCAVSVIASLSYAKNDSLNSLSLAALILLLINPLYLFGAGFLLSFGSVLGVIMLNRNLKSALRFLPEKLREPTSVGLSVQLSTAPTQFACFGYVSWAGLFLNVLIIPVISVAFLLLLFCTLASVVFPAAAGALVSFSAMPIRLLINLVVAAGFENAVILRTFGLWIYVPFVLVLIGLSDKFNLKPFWRSTLCSVAIVCFSLGLVAI